MSGFHATRRVWAPLTLIAVLTTAGCANFVNERILGDNDPGLQRIWPTTSKDYHDHPKRRVNLEALAGKLEKDNFSVSVALSRISADSIKLQLLFVEALGVSDRNCSEYRATLRGLGGAWQLIGVSTGAAGAMAGSPNSTKILSGISGFVSGVNPEKIFYQENSRTLITQTIASRRAKFSTQIKAKIMSSPNPAEIREMIDEYHSMCRVQDTVDYLGIAAQEASAKTPTMAGVLGEKSDADSRETDKPSESVPEKLKPASPQT